MSMERKCGPYPASVFLEQNNEADIVMAGQDEGQMLCGGF